MELDKYREEVDKIDDKLVKLLEERLEIVKKIGMLKKKENLELYHPEREKEVIRKNIGKLQNSENEKYVEELLKSVMDISKSVQRDI
ncbi:chorismate mutase [Peptostreptococcus faecalis]|uniref:chorismate mutase n=1 Tax=Peptostreptococcus faecalis TaxID=2045015 RepID=UPI000C7D3053|nr:chorismate mutase [Peptostreptococcus faecalis]